MFYSIELSVSNNSEPARAETKSLSPINIVTSLRRDSDLCKASTHIIPSPASAPAGAFILARMQIKLHSSFADLATL